MLFSLNLSMRRSLVMTQELQSFNQKWLERYSIGKLQMLQPQAVAVEADDHNRT